MLVQQQPGENNRIEESYSSDQNITEGEEEEKKTPEDFNMETAK